MRGVLKEMLKMIDVDEFVLVFRACYDSSASMACRRWAGRSRRLAAK